MAINVHHGLGETPTGLALAYAADRAILVLMYVGAARFAEPVARPLTRHHSIGFALAAAF